MMHQQEVPEPQNFKIGNLAAAISLVIAIIGFSSSAIFVRLSEQEISSNATVFDRLAIAAVILALWKGFSLTYHRLSGKEYVAEEFDISRDFWLLPAMAILDLGSQALWSWSLIKTDVAISTVLLDLRPLFTYLFAWIIWNQRFDNKFLSGILIAIVGAACIGVGDLQVGIGKIQGDIAALLAGVLGAGYLIVAEKLATKLSPTTTMLWVCFLATLFSLPIFLFTEDRLFPYSFNGWIFVITLALVCQVLAQQFLLFSLKKFSSAFVALFFLLESVLTGMQAWIIFGERLGLYDWIALFVIIFGLYLSLSSQSAIKE